MTERTFYTPAGVSAHQAHALGSFWDTIDQQGVAVDRIELTDGDDVELECSFQGDDAEELENHILAIVGGYVPIQEHGEFGDLEIIAHISEGTGSWTIPRTLIEQYRRDELSTDEYLQRVRATFEEVR